ncbi:hypothetical protein AB3X55_07710 [Alphaproteobacteria bacterium LSUCC0719]
MIRSGSHLWRGGLRPCITFGLGMWLEVCMTGPAPACSQQDSCGSDAIDGFFLSLITTSLGTPSRGTTHPPVLFPADTPSPLPPAGGAIVIPPPAMPEPAIHPDPSVPLTSVTPVQQLQIGQTLAGGTFREGGFAELFVEHLPSIDLSPEAHHDMLALTPALLSDLMLTPEAGGHDLLVMETLVSLPVGEAWPLHSLSQQVQMQVSCGACGPAGGIAHLVGTGRLHIRTAPWGSGSITGITLHAPGGPSAHGEMLFIVQTSDKAVFTDDEAVMRLVVGSVSTELATRLVAWHGQRRAVTGIFVGMPVDTGHDLGAFAGQFSGAGCDRDCGVEN